MHQKLKQFQKEDSISPDLIERKGSQAKASPVLELAYLSTPVF